MSSPQHYFGLIKKHWILFLSTILVVLLATWAWTEVRPSYYTSTAQVQVNPYSAENNGAQQAGLIIQYDASASIMSVAAIAESDAVLLRTRAALGSQKSLQELDKKIIAKPQSGSTLLLISAKAKSPQEAQRMASATVTSLQDFLTEQKNEKSQDLLRDLRSESRQAAKKRLPIGEIENRVANLIALQAGDAPLASLTTPASLPYKKDGLPDGMIWAVGILVALLVALLLVVAVSGPRSRR